MFFIRILNVHEDVLTLLIYDGAFGRENTIDSELIWCKKCCRRLPRTWRGGGNVFSTFDVISVAQGKNEVRHTSLA